MVGWRPPLAAANVLANARLASLASQYQGSVSIRPCAVFSPSASMSLILTSMPASFCPPLTMPNSAACLIALTVSPPALARATIFAFEAWACSRKDEKSLAASGWRTRPTHLALVGFHHRRGVALERMTERIVGCDEEPGVAAGGRDRLAGAVRQRPGVVGPMHRVGRAARSGQVGRRGAGGQEHLVLALDDVVDHERHRRRRHVDDDVDLLVVGPAVGDAGADVRLVLVVAGNDLDLEALARGDEIGDRLACGKDRSRPGRRGVETRQIGQHADLDRIVGGLDLRGNDRHSGRNTIKPSLAFMTTSLWTSCSRRPTSVAHPSVTPRRRPPRPPVPARSERCCRQRTARVARVRHAHDRCRRPPSPAAPRAPSRQAGRRLARSQTAANRGSLAASASSVAFSATAPSMNRVARSRPSTALAICGAAACRLAQSASARRPAMWRISSICREHRFAARHRELSRHQVDRLDAVGALVDRQDSRVAQMLGGAGLLDEAHPAVDLDAERGDLDGDVGRERLGDRRQ